MGVSQLWISAIYVTISVLVYLSSSQCFFILKVSMFTVKIKQDYILYSDRDLQVAGKNFEYAFLGLREHDEWIDVTMLAHRLVKPIGGVDILSDSGRVIRGHRVNVAEKQRHGCVRGSQATHYRFKEIRIKFSQFPKWILRAWRPRLLSNRSGISQSTPWSGYL